MARTRNKSLFRAIDPGNLRKYLWHKPANMPIPSKAPLLLLAILSSQFILAQPKTNAPADGLTHFGHLLFQTPPGWKTMQQADVFIMLPTDLAPDELLTYIIGAPVSDTNFERVAISTIKELATGLNGEAIGENIYGPSPLYVKQNEGRYIKGWEYSMGHGHIRVKYRAPNSTIDNYQFFYVGLFLVRLNGRVERITFLSKDIRRGPSENSTYRKPIYDAVVSNFFFDLEFDDWKDAPCAPGKITGTGIVRQWGGTAFFEGGTGPVYTVGSIKGTWLIFFDNGQVYYNADLPLHGLQQVNTWAESVIYPRWWGTYTYANGKGTIHLSYETVPFTLHGDSLWLELYRTRLPYSPFPSFSDLRLKGKWCGPVNGAGSQPCIALTLDGRFSDDGVIHRIEHPINDPFTGSPATGQGHYTISDNSIRFTYDNGYTSQVAFSSFGIAPGNPAPTELHLGYHDDRFKLVQP